jgi:AP-1-like factor
LYQKRKAQNRAAQRAFRERKEKHLKDLETKVGELEKASDATNHENGMLRAQVQRLQTELREYRKRLSLNSTGLGRAPAVTSGFASLNTGYGTSTNNFQFDFPKFGGLPGSHILDNGPLAKAKKPSTTTPARSNSSGASLSPKTQLNGTSSNSPSVNPTGSLTGHPNGLPNSNASSSTDINGLFSPMVNGVNSSSVFDYNTNTAGQSSRRSTDSSATQSRVFQFNSGSSTSDSPSASSVSQDGMGSSCDTSPEPSHNSPITALDTIKEGGCGAVNPEGEVTFCDKLNMACGNLRNPIPRALSQSNGTPAAAAATQSPAPDFGLDFLANQNGGQFDPTLFGDYRESQAAIVGDGDFTGGFFNDAFPLADFGSPFNIGDNNTPAIQKSNPLEEIERIQDGLDDEVVPGEDPSQLLNCHKIW